MPIVAAFQSPTLTRETYEAVVRKVGIDVVPEVCPAHAFVCA
jgi:hypothetical protein